MPSRRNREKRGNNLRYSNEFACIHYAKWVRFAVNRSLIHRNPIFLIFMYKMYIFDAVAVATALSLISRSPPSFTFIALHPHLLLTNIFMQNTLWGALTHNRGKQGTHRVRFHSFANGFAISFRLLSSLCILSLIHFTRVAYFCVFFPFFPFDSFSSTFSTSIPRYTFIPANEINVVLNVFVLCIARMKWKMNAKASKNLSTKLLLLFFYFSGNTHIDKQRTESRRE